MGAQGQAHFATVRFQSTAFHLQVGPMAKFALLASLLAGVGATELTVENWEAETAGKTIFIKFQAPW